MNVGPPLIVLAILSMVLTAWDLHRRGSTDVLLVVLLAVLGLLSGALLSAVVPGGFIVGGMGGAALAATRFKEVVRARRRRLTERVEASASPSEALLSLHDRVDELRGRSRRRSLRVMGWLAMLGLASVALGVLGVGLSSGVVPITVIGVALTVLPAAAVAEVVVTRDEREFAQMLLDRARDPPLPRGAGGVE